MNNTMIRLLGAIAFSTGPWPIALIFTTMSHLAVAQAVIPTPQPTNTPTKPPVPQPTTTQPSAPQTPTQPPVPQPTTTQPSAPPLKTTQKLCSSDAAEDSLPPVGQQSNSSFAYLKQQGFRQNQDGSWVCYENDSRQSGRYYTLFKVQQVNGKLVASSFLDRGNLIPGQENRSVDLFMTLVDKYTNTTQENRQSIRRYLEQFTSLVKQGKIQPSNHAYLFDQPNRGYVIYHSLSGGKLQGTAITINIDLPQNLAPSRVF